MTPAGFPRWPTIGCLALAVALHVAVVLSAISVFVLLLSAVNLLPFMVCLVISRWPSMRLAAFLGSAAALALDAYMHYQVLVVPTATTSPIPLLFGPGVNVMFGVIPGMVIGGVIAFLWSRLGKRREGAPRGAK